MGTATGGATQNRSTGERFVVFGSGAAQRYYERWFDRWLPSDGSVSYRTLGWETCGLSIAGPRSRELLERVTASDVGPEAFRFMDFRELDLGHVPVWCGRITFTGDLGFEFWMPASCQRTVFDVLRTAGEDLGLRLFGLNALNSLRLDKGFGSWAREYRPIYDPLEAGLSRFVKLDKDFIGRDAVAAVESPERRLLTWTVDGGEPAAAEAGVDVIGDEPVWHDGRVVGWVTSGGYAHHSRVSVAMGYVPAELEGAEGGFEIEILGVRRSATPVDGCLWDRHGERMRS